MPHAEVAELFAAALLDERIGGGSPRALEESRLRGQGQSLLARPLSAASRLAWSGDHDLYRPVRHPRRRGKHRRGDSQGGGGGAVAQQESHAEGAYAWIPLGSIMSGSDGTSSTSPGMSISCVVIPNSWKRRAAGTSRRPKERDASL